MSTSTNEEIHARIEGRNVCTEFLRTVAAHGDLVALRSMNEDGSWREWTYEQFAHDVATVAAGLKKLGVGHGDRVVLMMRNIPEFHIIDMAVLFCGGTPVSIYNSSSPEQIVYLTSHCGATVAVLEDHGFLERFLKVSEELPALNQMVILSDPQGLAGPDVVQWSTLCSGDRMDLVAEAGTAKPDDLATIIYTSGTTGNPKGVMLSHSNICWTVESLRETLELPDTLGKRVVSYLPMAHIAERMTSYYTGAFLGYEISSCPEPGQIAAYAREVKPNILFGVPRVWEKIYGGIHAALAADPEKLQKVNEAVAAAIPITEAMAAGTATQEQLDTYAFLDDVAFATIRGLVGMDELDMAITGAAPIPADMIRWFRAIGVPLSEVYGMSENSGPMCLTAWKPRVGTVGQACAGVEVKIAEDGEVCCRGGNVFVGYLNDPDKTAEALDADGWLHSGDIGEMDADGYVKIVDRKKELIITAGGKNISPANLEAALKTIPLVGQAAAIGDSRPFVSALVVLDSEIAPLWAEQHGVTGKTLAELAEDPVVVAEIEAGLAEAMSGFNNAERVKKVTVLGEEWMPDSELLTPTSKLKRRGVNVHFAAEIEAMYS